MTMSRNYPDKTDPSWNETARVEAEMSIVWAAHNPELFQESYDSFFDIYSEEFEITARVRSGFLTLVAERKQEISAIIDDGANAVVMYKSAIDK